MELKQFYAANVKNFSAFRIILELAINAFTVKRHLIPVANSIIIIIFRNSTVDDYKRITDKGIACSRNVLGSSPPSSVNCFNPSLLTH